ncbi:DUF4389 domain-containing protein [Nocardia speluncae]|uniref:DUF4389 domain-containing protein n=1 Tax=Nocardia speluncae TaxID=419477 RepID=A0A846XJI2_9NOCA|nr:DUF4389 domain-containing protein [Nocardia speluncae]NKY34820.1 DUF4389 domain-containing protein [Nocardia speluncae]
MSAPTGYPVRVRGDLDPALSRWMWIVKWILAIPHYIVLFFLHIGYAVVTVIAFFAILITGRYPRVLFDYSVGVIRWSWRVSYYAWTPAGTDKYPPFTLSADDNYPADLDVDYPPTLHRGLVLVKWWLLAIPHYLIIGAMTGAAWVVTDDADAMASAAGLPLIGVLTLVALVGLLFVARYSQGLFDFLMGVNRWMLRVQVYSSLLRDEYPPFRLDQGAREQTPPAAGKTEPAA